MRRHKPKVSRKKLIAENKKLQGQIISANLVNVLLCQTSQLQIALMHAQMMSKVPEGGTIVEVNR